MTLRNNNKALSSNYKKHTTKNPLRRALLTNFHEKLAVEAFDMDPNSVLSVGCGEGFVISFLSNLLLNTKFYGIDISNESIEIARQNNPQATFAVRSLTDLKNSDLQETFNLDRFDLILCLEVLEHIPDYRTALKNLKDLNSENFIISVPNEPFFKIGNLLALKNIPRMGNDPEHVNNWTTRDFIKLIEEDFEIIKKLYPFPWQMFVCKKKN